jgi:hypothetical protein
MNEYPDFCDGCIYKELEVCIIFTCVKVAKSCPCRKCIVKMMCQSMCKKREIHPLLERRDHMKKYYPRIKYIGESCSFELR